MRKLGDIFPDKSGQCRGNTNLIFIHSEHITTSHWLCFTPWGAHQCWYFCLSWVWVRASLSWVDSSVYYAVYCSTVHLYCAPASPLSSLWLRLWHTGRPPPASSDPHTQITTRSHLGRQTRQLSNQVTQWSKYLHFHDRASQYINTTQIWETAMSTYITINGMSGFFQGNAGGLLWKLGRLLILVLSAMITHRYST